MQRSKPFSRIFAAFSALILFAAPTHAAPAKPIDVLMIGHYIPRDFEPSWPKFQQACAREGVRVHILNADMTRGLDYPLYTSDLLRQFQVIIFSGVPIKTSNTASSDAEVAAFRDRLDAYYKAGGGVIWTPMAFDQWGGIWNKTVGDKYDAHCLVEDLYDPPKTVDINPALNNRVYRYIWTTNVSPHPVTEGVRGLLLPATGEWSWPGTVPMQFGKTWTTLIRGMDSTITIRNTAPEGSGRPEFSPDAKGTCSGAPEIVGARDSIDGSGRMFVFPFHSTHTWLNFNHFAFNDAMMLNGDGAHPSDGLRLFLNACHWLAEPADKAGLGGYRPPKVNDQPSLQPLDWSHAAFPPNSWGGMASWWDDMKQADIPMTDLLTPEGRDFKGLVGVRTGASDGQGSAADYVAEAKKLGLSFIIFLEDVASSDDARYDKLAADCKALSDNEFSAIPGFLYRDLGNNLHFAYDVPHLPLAENLTPDRHVIAPNDIVDQNHWGSGQGLAELGKLKVDMSYLFLFTAVAPFVYDGPRLVDDGFSTYCYSEGLGHQFAPVSLVIVRRPQDMAAAVAAAPLTIVHAENLDGVHLALSRDGQHPHPVYLSNGPVIKRWGALNPLGHPFWPGKERVRFSLVVQSDAGLRDIKLIDGVTGAVFREFHPDGAKTFDCEVDETHKQQWCLIPEVTDINGRRAVAAGLQTYEDGNRLWLMGDRLMGMSHSFGWDQAHRKLMKMGGWLAGITWIKPYLDAGGYPPNPRETELKIQGIDGGAIHSSAIDINPSVATSSGTEPKVSAFRFHNTLASFDYGVIDYLGGQQFLVNKRQTQKHGWWSTPDASVPNQVADIDARTWAVRGRYLAPLSANVHEITVTFKCDTTLESIRLAGMRSGGEKVSPLVMLRDTAGEFTWLVPPGQPFHRSGVLDTGGYLFPANYRGGAVGIVNLGPEPIDYDCGGMSSQIYVAGNGRPVKAGDKITLRFLTFTRPWQDQLNNEWLKKFIADFGIGCLPGYQYALTQGKLRAVNYSLDLDSADGGATLEVKKYELPHNLAVRVFGLPANAIAGRYDLDRHQLLILPVLEGMAPTSINTTLGDTRLYTGELFHCSDTEVRLSAVQDGPDKLLVELHNPTDQPRTVQLSAVSGFPPLSNLSESIQLPPFTSVKRTLPTPSGSLVYTPYQGD